MEYPRFTTFSDAEKIKLGIPLADRNPSITGPRPRSRLIKTCSCEVCYPDGTKGKCAYERMAPAWHRFDYFYGDGSKLARIHLTRPLPNSVPDIEGASQDFASKAFLEAMEWERKDHFARASEPTSGARKKDPSKYRMRAGEAKEKGGLYALCMKVGEHLVPVAGPFKRFEEAADRWEGNPDLLACCCNRLDRRWELLRYNPLTAKGHPRRP